MTSSRQFRFRLQSQHPAPERTSTDLAVQWLNAEDNWEPQNLSLTMPGFRIYLISLLLCQHYYLVANARERQLPLARVEAEFSVTATQDWILKSVIGTFQVQLDAGDGRGLPEQGLAADIAGIQERMKACPVSRNLQEGVEKITTIQIR
jgi:hypothetical protein